MCDGVFLFVSAHVTKRQTVRRLIEEGRLEMATGGWVMTDEANSHLFAMLDQLIEGHQWLKTNLGVVPRTGWSIDPFGHGATVPYLLRASGLKGGTVVQRLHYAWKRWFAENRMGDFLWRQPWDTDGHTDMLTHNQPFDIYSIKHSCGPHTQVCLNFDFRKISGEYTEYSIRTVPITDKNKKQKAEMLLQQFARTGSLNPHNVVLMPLGDDFRYTHEQEWDQQYSGYKKLADYINKHSEQYNAQVVFGTPADYFEAVRERVERLKTLQGDFFVYSDIFSENRPAYWSGYFTTRPYWKVLDRELAASLRSAEILYALTLNRARREGLNHTVKLLEGDYEKLIVSRHNLALFQHHDAITGTSRATVMHDYALKLFEGIQHSGRIQRRCVHTLLLRDPISPAKELVLSDTDRESYEVLPRKVPLDVRLGHPRTVVVFNSLAQHRQDVVKLTVTSPDVRVLDSDGNVVVSQVNPLWTLSEQNEGSPDATARGDLSIQMNKDHFEVMFIADLAPLSLLTYKVERMATKQTSSRALVYCDSCAKAAISPFDVKPMQSGDIQLENHALKVLFDGRSGLMKAVTRKSTGATTQCNLQFAAYSSAQFHSGAYLFMPDPSREAERNVLEEYGPRHIVITSGPVASELTVMFGRDLMHTSRLYHSDGPLSQGVYMDNYVDLGAPPKNRETELFMRFVSDIKNGDPPEFYSDQNGFQMQKRVKIERIGIEGNYYPLTSSAYIEDNRQRLTLLVNHAQGAASWQPGWLEVMLDRRTLYDDARGMGEGVVDNKRTLTKYWLLVEDTTPQAAPHHSRLTLLSNHLSNSLIYPSNVFVLEGGQTPPVPTHRRVHLVNRPFPCDVHLMNLRTLTDPGFQQFPAPAALLVLHRQGYACDVGTSPTSAAVPKCALVEESTTNSSTGLLALHPKTAFSKLRLESVAETSLTALVLQNKLDSLDQARLKPMELLTLNLTFGL